MEFRIVQDANRWAIAPVSNILPAVNENYQVTVIVEQVITPFFNSLEELTEYVRALVSAFNFDYVEIIKVLNEIEL